MGVPTSPLRTETAEVVRLAARRHGCFFVLAIHGDWCAVGPDTRSLA